MLNRSRLIIVAICVVYIASRLWRLSDSCLWFDEIFSVHAAELAWSSLFSFVAQDLIHPPLFYIVLKFWIGIGGDSVFWLRLLPVVFSTLALVPFVRLGRELKLETSAILIGLFLFAVNGAMIKYTQTLRMYSMLMFLALLSMWLFARYFNRGKSFIPLLITNILLVYTHYFGWMVIGAEVAAILIFQRIKWRRALSMTAIVTASFIPWLLAVWQAMRQGSDLGQNIAWQARPGGRELWMFVLDMVEPFYFQASSAEPTSIFVVSVPLLLILATTLIVYLSGWKDEERKQPIYLLLIFIGLPLVLAFAASWILPHSIWGTRHLIVIFAPLMLVLGHAASRLPATATRITIICLVVAICVVAFAINFRRETPRHVWCAWNQVAAEIRATGHESTIYAFENLVAYHLWFALRDTDAFPVAVVKGVDVRSDDETYFLPRGFDGVARASLDQINDDSMWLAIRTSKAGEELPILAEFTRLGYAVCHSYHRDYGTTTVFWIEARKVGCSAN